MATSAVPQRTISTEAMASGILTRFSDLIGEALRRPLSLREIVHVAFVLFVVGTVYCQLYCAISTPAMDGMSMPLTLSMFRSALETVPALIAFEVSKRVLSRGVNPRTLAGVAAALLVAAAVSTALNVLCNDLFCGSAMPLRPVLADRLPGITLTAIAIAWASREARVNASIESSGDSASEDLPPAEWIDWISAAGNYIEIRVRGRSVLKRMTMAQAEQALAGEAFVRIHRSMLVNRSRIAGRDRAERPRHLRLSDGRVVKVGEAYRKNLE